MNINKIIENEQVIIKYQPIMSTHNKGFLGLEALVRGWVNDEEINPFQLFNEAKLNSKVLELDKLCIRKSIEGFSDFYRFNQKTLLFINIDASVIDYYIHNDYIEALIVKNRIKFSNIVLEINELRSFSLEKMKEFSQKYRHLGCLIALDDIGAGESNLDRIPLIMPDIMKIDKELIQGLSKSFYQKQVVARIIELATDLGSLVVIEGVETMDDINQISEFGAHLIQGYFLGKPDRLSESFYLDIMENKTKIIKLLYQYNKMINNNQKMIHDYMNIIADEIKFELVILEEQNYKKAISKKICKYEEVESVYILNENGYLITDTVFNQGMNYNLEDPLYTPCIKGDSLELEEYYTKIKYGGYAFWITREYISMASGHKSYTYSSKFQIDCNTSYIICIDFNSYKMNHKLKNEKKVVNYA